MEISPIIDVLYHNGEAIGYELDDPLDEPIVKDVLESQFIGLPEELKNSEP